MKLLLDTHAVIWWMEDPGKLSKAALESISEPENDVIVSAVVAWEIAIKRGMGKLSCPSDLRQRISDSQFRVLPVTLDHALAVESLPFHHRDPFDRMLIAQAIAEDAVLVSRDKQFSNYDVTVLKA